jgi:hypothetical protein
MINGSCPHCVNGDVKQQWMVDDDVDGTEVTLAKTD